MRLIARAARVSRCKISDKKLQQNVHQLALAADIFIPARK